MPGDWWSSCNRWRRRRLSFCKERATGKFVRRFRARAAVVKTVVRVPKRTTTVPMRGRLGPVLGATHKWKSPARNTENSDDGRTRCGTFRVAHEPVVEDQAAGLSGLYSGTPSTGGYE